VPGDAGVARRRSFWRAGPTSTPARSASSWSTPATSSARVPRAADGGAAGLASDIVARHRSARNVVVTPTWRRAARWTPANCSTGRAGARDQVLAASPAGAHGRGRGPPPAVDDQLQTEDLFATLKALQRHFRPPASTAASTGDGWLPKRSPTSARRVNILRPRPGGTGRIFAFSRHIRVLNSTARGSRHDLPGRPFAATAGRGGVMEQP
jgi:hypothetical protein